MANYGGDDEDMDDGVTFHDRLEFWGVQVPPNKKVDIVFGETDEELIHLTQARGARCNMPPAAPCAAAGVRRGACDSALHARCSHSCSSSTALAAGLPPCGARSTCRRERDRDATVPYSVARR
jgi:hypothetical protein